MEAAGIEPAWHSRRQCLVRTVAGGAGSHNRGLEGLAVGQDVTASSRRCSGTTPDRSTGGDSRRSAGLPRELTRSAGIAVFVSRRARSRPPPTARDPGSRVIRKPLTSPSRAASSGMSSAIWSALGLASVLMWMISALTSAGWPTSSSSRCVFVITSAFFSSPSRPCSCSAGREHVARVRHVREEERERREHDRARRTRARTRARTIRRRSSRRPPR